MSGQVGQHAWDGTERALPQNIRERDMTNTLAQWLPFFKVYGSQADQDSDEGTVCYDRHTAQRIAFTKGKGAMVGLKSKTSGQWWIAAHVNQKHDGGLVLDVMLMQALI